MAHMHVVSTLRMYARVRVHVNVEHVCACERAQAVDVDAVMQP